MKERLIDIKFLKDETQEQKSKACKEEEALKTYKQRLLNAIEMFRDKAIKICENCIILRGNRLSVDKVIDEVDQELNKELNVINGSLNLLNKTLEEASEQIRRIRCAIYMLDRDLSNKEKSLQIDETNLCMRQNKLCSFKEEKGVLDPL